MIPKDFFTNIRRIQITTSRLVTDVFAGQYHSVFKGRGMEFDEVREYQIGDDIRSIDWNVTARTGRAHVKKYVEERELTVMLLIDVSLSCRFGTAGKLKSQLAAELAAVLAFSAIRNNDKVGVIFFSDRIEKFVPPRRGTQHVLRVIREILYFEPQHKATHITAALDYLNRVTTRRSVAFVISDFYEPDTDFGANDAAALKKGLTTTNRRHDLIAVTLNDPAEMHLPEAGLVALEDAETGRLTLVDTGAGAFREEYHRRAVTRVANRQRLFRSAGLDQIDIWTDRPFSSELVKFFKARRQRWR